MTGIGTCRGIVFMLWAFAAAPAPLAAAMDSLDLVLFVFAPGDGRGSYGLSFIDLLYMNDSVIATACGEGFSFFAGFGGGIDEGGGGGFLGTLLLTLGGSFSFSFSLSKDGLGGSSLGDD